MLPFHSFAEVTDLHAQQKALAAIRKHLLPEGRFICPLHNAPARLKLVDGVKRVRGRFPVGNEGQSLVLSSVENCYEIPGLVRGTQYYDIFDKDDQLLQHREAGVCFYLHTVESFRTLLEEAGFEIEALYGDYEYGSFKSQESLFMIWVLK
jgi:hypothetical protein